MSNAASAFSSVFMTLPLIAVPCLAVFGLPSIGPASAEAEVDESITLDIHDADASLGDSSDAAAFPPIVDLGGTASASSTSAGQPASSGHPDIAPTSGHLGVGTAAGANQALRLEDSTSASPENPFQDFQGDHGHAGHDHAAGDGHEHDPGIADDLARVSDAPRVASAAGAAAMPPASVSSPTWEAALARLNRLGIRDFHLTNSDVPGQFYFSCNMSETGRNVVRRFEAEAATPVAAAEDVLKQVEACIASR